MADLNRGQKLLTMDREFVAGVILCPLSKPSCRMDVLWATGNRHWNVAHVVSCRSLCVPTIVLQGSKAGAAIHTA